MRLSQSLFAPVAVMFLGLIGPGAVALSAESQVEAVSPVEAQVFELLRTLRDPAAPGPLVVGEQLQAQGSTALPILFRVLDERRVPDPLESDGAGQVLSEPQTTAVLSALDRFGRVQAHPEWRLYFRLDAASEAEEEPVDLVAAMTALGGFGLSQDLEELWGLLRVDPVTATALPRSLRVTMESTLTAILLRDPKALRQLRSVWTSLPDAWIDSLARSVGKTRDSIGMELILEMLRLATGHERVVASQVSMLGPSNDRSINSEVVACLLDLVESESNVDAQTAILGLGSLEENSVIPVLIELLDDTRGGLNSSALRALKELTGSSYHGSSSVWRRWHEGELKWVREEQSRTIRQLSSGDATVVKTSLKVIARHRLERHALARSVVETLGSNNVSVRLQAVQVLEELDSRWTYGDLAGLLDDPAEVVRSASHAALMRLTGLSYGPHVVDWEPAEFP